MDVLTDAQVAHAWEQIEVQAHRLALRTGSEGGFSVAPGSALADDDQASAPYQVSHAVRTSITAATDHLHALCVLALRSQILHVSAPATVARGVLECASAAVWIMSPPNRTERITRSLKWNMQDIRDGDKAATKAQIPVRTVLTVRQDKVRSFAIQRSIAYKTVKDGYSSTDAVTAAESYLRPPLGVLLPWQIASGFAHGRRWAMIAYSDQVRKPSTEAPDVVNVKMENDLGKALYLALAGASVLQSAVNLFDQYSKVP